MWRCCRKRASAKVNGMEMVKKSSWWRNCELAECGVLREQYVIGEIVILQSEGRHCGQFLIKEIFQLNITIFKIFELILEMEYLITINN